jgi:response regulator RpfG family c-di-GMP phosphodiesterase
MLMNEPLPDRVRILAVDDEPAILTLYQRVLSPPNRASGTQVKMEALAARLFDEPADQSSAVSFEVTLCRQGDEAVEAVRKAVEKDERYAVAFIDVRMPPGPDGIRTAETIRSLDSDIQIVIVTAYADVDAQEIASRVRPVDKLLYVQKPFHAQEIRQFGWTLGMKWHVERQLRKMNVNLEAEVEMRTAQIAETRDVAVFALAKLAESRDPETGEHLERLRAYCQILAEQLAANGPYVDQVDARFRQDLYRSAPMHDIGKVGIPDMILLKPGRLTTSEFEIMKQHTVIGAEALEDAARHTGSGGFLAMAVDIARSHHERWDGSGYPDGLKAEEIPLPARIVALADVYDAMTTVRVYKPAFSCELARAMIDDQIGKHFDPVIIEAFRTRYRDILSVRGLVDSHSNTLAPVLVSTDSRR